MRLRRSKPDDTALAADVAALRADLEAVQADLSILWAIAPTWVTACIPFCGENGWAIEIKTDALYFKREDPYGEARVPLPLGEDQELHRRELYARLGFVGPAGAMMPETARRARPRIMDLRG